MIGWNLKEGSVLDDAASEEKLWSVFNFIFSDSSRKTNTYKFALVKSILDNLFSTYVCFGEAYISYDDIFEKFSANYWNLIVKYHLHQMRRNGKSEYSKLEQIFHQVVINQPVLSNLEFYSLEKAVQKNIIKQVAKSCRKYVLGALYADTEGLVYSFNISGDGVYICENAYNFMLTHKKTLEQLNYYAWAKFLESINNDDVLVRLLDKLEIATPKRSDLTLYRRLLFYEFEQETCFYCGRKLEGIVHVDHFIPWSIVKNDRAWNFVLSCQKCNLKKSDKLLSEPWLNKVIIRNEKLKLSENEIVKCDFKNYSQNLLHNIWEYASKIGYKQCNF